MKKRHLAKKTVAVALAALMAAGLPDCLRRQR